MFEFHLEIDTLRCRREQRRAIVGITPVHAIDNPDDMATAVLYLNAASKKLEEQMKQMKESQR